jgi:hypothetical protein
LPNVAGAPDEPAAACVNCGSTRRDGFDVARATITAGSPEAVAREPDPDFHGGSLRKPARERRVGMSLTREDGIERLRRREYDRKGDWYEETIIDPDGLKQSGEVENLEVAILEVHGGDLGGFILLRGDQEQLGRVRASAEFQHLVLRGGFAVEHVGVISALLDGEAARFVGESNSITADLT